MGRRPPGKSVERNTLRIALILLATACIASPSAAVAEPTPTLARAMASEVSALRASLPAADREEASYPFDDPERFDLRLAPFGLEGLEMERMNAAAKGHLGGLLEVSLGPVGRRKADEIRALEPEVIRQEPWYMRAFTGVLGIRGAEAYFLSVFGQPEDGGPWGYRFDGHHLSANMTVVGDHVSATPLFLGAQPREIPAGGIGPSGRRVLAEEEDRARTLYESLDETQRAKATVELEEGRGLFVGDGERVDPDLPPIGIAVSDLTKTQRDLVDQLLEVYFGNVAEPIAARERARADAAGRAGIHFAWAGSTTPGEEIYYRVHGPTLLIEFDNTVDDANHIHTLWRDPSGDFGRDLLRDHHAAAHAPPQP